MWKPPSRSAPRPDSRNLPQQPSNQSTWSSKFGEERRI